MRVYLLGFMGSGKSYWAKRWSAKYEFDFYDVDDTIEAMEMSSVVDLFEKKGEQWYREKEAAVLRELNNYQDCIISCGGGTPCYHENMDWMNQNGFTIYLESTPEYLLQNILKEKERRPLVKNVNESELLYFIQQKLEERIPVYNQAQLTLNAAAVSETTFGGILYSLNR